MNENMSRAERRRQRKLAEKATKNKGFAPSASLSVNKPTFDVQQALEQAIQLHGAGDLPKAEHIYNQVLQANPNQPVALHLLGVIAHQVGRNDAAVNLISKALSIQPDYGVAHGNLGNALLGLGHLEQAINSYQTALTIDPENLEAQYNIGNALKQLGRLEDAIACYRKVLVINPDIAEAHNNLGNVLQEQGKLDEAIASYNSALTLNPGFAEAHSNLGAVQREQGKLEQAVASCQRAVEVAPDYTLAHINLGNALSGLGNIKEAVSSFHTALTIQPDYREAWNNLEIVAKIYRYLYPVKSGGPDFCKFGLSSDARATVDFAIFEHALANYRPDQADESYDKTLLALPPKSGEEIPVDGAQEINAEAPTVPQKMVALLHFGRSGTGLLHSLVDGHPEISTLPSIYLRGYFSAGIWARISAGGWRELPARFVSEFEVLFDARTSKSPPGDFRKDSSFLGQKEGMTNVGEGRDEVLSVDREKFCSVALELMQGFDNIDPGSFLQIVHAAFERVTNASTDKDLIFYHIHNPQEFTKLNFLRYAPDAKLVFMVREPLRSCESWVRNAFKKGDYNTICFRIASMLYAFDQVALRKHDSVGIRLEDLKSHPEPTMRALCDWLGVTENPCLYEMTAQGKKWWGDPSSPHYDENKAMEPFGEDANNDKVGDVFSENDQFVLRTLFYPFSVRFGYQNADPVQFDKDLQEIRPRLEDMFDFEKAIIEKTGTDPATFKRQADYSLLRAGLLDRWEVLSSFKDYPHMLTPLAVD
jgi:tetratricopeptide (TPR) repeat protein